MEPHEFTSQFPCGLGDGEPIRDLDENVRRNTYSNIAGYQVKSYTNIQRMTILEQGLRDPSSEVRKAVTDDLLPKWFHSYNQNCLTLLAALMKIDANEEEFEKFLRIAKDVLLVIFRWFVFCKTITSIVRPFLNFPILLIVRNENIEDIIQVLPLATTATTNNQFEKCVPFEKLTIEMAVYWLSVIEYLRGRNEDDRLGRVICELTGFCSYVDA